MAERNRDRAVSFYNRALNSDDLQQRLLCLYDGFVCLYGPIDACRKAAAAASVDRDYLDRVLDCCMDDGDSDSYREEGYERVPPTEELVSALQNALGALTADCR